jgi:hypothetical protein
VWRGEEAFPGQNASGKGPDGAVRQMGVKASELQAGIKSKTRLKSALSKKSKSVQCLLYYCGGNKRPIPEKSPDSGG